MLTNQTIIQKNATTGRGSMFWVKKHWMSKKKLQNPMQKVRLWKKMSLKDLMVQMAMEWEDLRKVQVERRMLE